MENAPLLELEFDALLEGDVEEPKAKRRFASLTEDEIQSIDEGRRPHWPLSCVRRCVLLSLLSLICN